MVTLSLVVIAILASPHEQRVEHVGEMVDIVLALKEMSHQLRAAVSPAIGQVRLNLARRGDASQ